MNARIHEIETRNREALAAISVFRKGTAVSRSDLANQQQAVPFFGLVPCRASGIDFVMLHAHDDVVAREYLWLGEDGYEPEITKIWVEWCREPGVVLDIGAYSGLMSILAARANSKNEVHLFEPMLRTVERANLNLKLNGVSQRVRRHAVAVSNTEGEAEICLYRAPEFLGTGNSIGAKAGLKVVERQSVRTVKLDEHLPTVRPNAVKIDVEGHELSCLAGMRKILEASRPRVIIEIWQETREDVLTLIGGIGYDVRRIEASSRRVENYIATPRR